MSIYMDMQKGRYDSKKRIRRLMRLQEIKQKKRIDSFYGAESQVDIQRNRMMTIKLQRGSFKEKEENPWIKKIKLEKENNSMM